MSQPSSTDWCLARMQTVGAILAARLGAVDGVRSASYQSWVLTVEFRGAATPLALDLGAVVAPACAGESDADRVDAARKLYLAYLLPRLEDVAGARDKEAAVRRLQADFGRKRRVTLRAARAAGGA